MRTETRLEYNSNLAFTFYMNSLAGVSQSNIKRPRIRLDKRITIESIEEAIERGMKAIIDTNVIIYGFNREF